jgi:hypothetical protein
MKVPDGQFRLVRGAADISLLVASLFDHTACKPQVALGITNIDVLQPHFPEYNFSSGNASRLAAGVPGRVIYTSSNGPVYGRSDKLLNRESRYLPPHLLERCGDVTIVDDTVVFMSEEGSDVVALAVTSPLVARQMRGLFELVWARAK